MSSVGGWIMLQNVHLMSSWLPRLDRKLEVCSETAHEDFRCYISGEPPSLSYMKNMPESLLQACIKVANESPSDIKSNMRRAWASFDKSRLDTCLQPVEFRGTLLGLCFFHSCLVGRIRFGQQGWSRKYSFNMGDLRICGDVLTMYLDAANDDETLPKGLGERVPWQDLRYIFGEIMYGGHITDFWDRRTCNSYLSMNVTKDCLMHGGSLLGGYGPNPNPTDPAMTYEAYQKYIEEETPPEAPPLYGLHPNAEIAFLQDATMGLFGTIMRLRAGGGGGGSGANDALNAVIDGLMETVPPNFDMITANEKAEPLFASTDPGIVAGVKPFVVVIMQECGRMNVLLDKINISLDELKKGLAGQLNMSLAMEDMAEALSINQVPGRNPFHKASWEKLAWHSMKPLTTWWLEVEERCKTDLAWANLEEPGKELTLPNSLWLSALFNPVAFLTAVKQATARSREFALDQMSIETHITTMMDYRDCTEYPSDGKFIHGLYMMGARWTVGQNPGSVSGYTDDVMGVKCAGVIADSFLKDLYPPMPVVYCKAVIVQPAWEPTSVGYIRHESDLFNSPVYLNPYRGPTFVFSASLKTLDPPDKWVLAAVCLVMNLAN
jgi:dynein heavy chain